MGIKNEQEMARDHREWRKIILEAKICNRLKKKKKKEKKKKKKRQEKQITRASLFACGKSAYYYLFIDSLSALSETSYFINY
jgi:hypothetical protein